jgi:putative tryptophan/tyrosine transport system substrate-binding protein
MKRRDFLLMAGAAGLAAPAARAQAPGKVRRIAFVHSSIPADQLIESGGTRVRWVGQFFQELRRLGDFEGVGGNLIVERYSGEGHSRTFADLARKVVNNRPNVVVTVAPLIPAFRAATQSLPIAGFLGDPVILGFVDSLAHPGGNVTGVSIDAGVEVYGKQLQILKEVIPSIGRVGYLATDRVWKTQIAQAARDASQQLGISLMGMVLPEVTTAELRQVFQDADRWSLDAVAVSPSGELAGSIENIVELVGARRLPAMYAYREYVEAGGLMAYAPELGEPARHLASQVHQILNGKKPGAIPIFQATKFELLLNQHTARGLGIEFPQVLLARADEVIE